MRTSERNAKRTPSPDNAEHKENDQTMKKIYYRNHNALPKAVLASQNENGSWTVEKQAVAGAVPLGEDGFRYAYRDEPRDGESWTTGHRDFGGAEGIAEAIADGAEPRWLTTKEEVQQWAEKRPEAWFLDLKILGVWKREDLPWGTVRDYEEGLSLDWDRDDDWALPLVVLVPAEEAAGRQG